MNRRSFLKKTTAVAGAAIAQEVLTPLAQTQTNPSAVGETQPVAASGSPGDTTTLMHEDFSGFPPGWLSQPIGQLNGAIQEYHYFAHRGVPTGRWANAICHMDAWVVSDEDGKPYLEQHTVNDLAALTNPILVTGDPLWSDYTVEARVKPLSLAEMAGIVFRYHSNRHYYLFALT
ncbi:MAG: hypothetical protein DMG67_08900 [Acidobacteria bacterium]|nr:MAG: hypothetical protein DMG67_08900 [Acidobacteriota bacterium]